MLLLCGDLTDYGTVEEGKILAKEITSSLRIPAIAVLGNHDYESSHEKELVEILTDAGVAVAVLHYSPIQATIGNEPLEIAAFLGSSRLEVPLDRYRVNAVFHGHAHRGTPEGRTKSSVPVYNVAMPVLAAAFPEEPQFRVIEVPVGEAAVA